LTGATRLAGTVLAATAGYAALDALERAIRDVRVPADSAVAGEVGSPTAGDD
jgi:hypothetical protein